MCKVTLSELIPKILESCKEIVKLIYEIDVKVRNKWNYGLEEIEDLKTFVNNVIDLISSLKEMNCLKLMDFGIRYHNVLNNFRSFVTSQFNRIVYNILYLTNHIYSYICNYCNENECKKLIINDIGNLANDLDDNWFWHWLYGHEIDMLLINKLRFEWSLLKTYRDKLRS